MYQIRFRPAAMQDITQLRDYIHTECAAPSYKFWQEDDDSLYC